MLESTVCAPGLIGSIVTRLLVPDVDLSLFTLIVFLVLLTLLRAMPGSR